MPAHKRPRRNFVAPTAVALSEWPDAPEDFDADERKAWVALGKALLPLRSISVSDLLMVEGCARVLARVEKEMINPDVKVTALNNLLRTRTDLLRHLGLSPLSRRGVEALPTETTDGDDPFAE